MSRIFAEILKYGAVDFRYRSFEDAVGGRRFRAGQEPGGRAEALTLRGGGAVFNWNQISLNR